MHAFGGYPRRLSWFILTTLLLLAAGCKSMTPGDLSRVQPGSDQRLAGNVYLLRGFIGIWSYGIDGLGRKIAASGIRASVFQEDQWQGLAEAIASKYRSAADHEPLILIGHSYGADDTLRIAKRLEAQNLHVDLVITLDPVTPPRVSPNVRLCYNLYQSNTLDALPFFRGVKLESELPEEKNLVNVNIRADRRDLLESNTDHFNIEKNPKVHDEVICKLKEFCPPREAWLAQRRTSPPRTILQDHAPSGVSDNPQRVGATDAPAQRDP
ncbi:MAG: thioesterase domain-containing protein [Planctomycetota bacterium]|nr:thioesterase domain-containing protein [Planctomycetota bacterium]